MLTRLKCVTVSILFMINFGCIQKNTRLQIHKLVAEYISQNFDKYADVYEEVSEIIKKMIHTNQKRAIDQIGHDFRIDSLIIFNKDHTKFYTTINTNFKEYGGSNDMIQSLYGVKIEGKWYVFIGHQNLIVMRDSYKYDKYEPFTWDEISFMAHEQMFGRYISIDKSGSLIINYDQLDKDTGVRELTGKIPGEYSTPDDAFISLNEYNESQTLDSLEIAQIKEDLEAGKNKPRDPIKKVTWCDRLWGKEIPIFETDEWKEYVKSKNQGQ